MNLAPVLIAMLLPGDPPPPSSPARPEDVTPAAVTFERGEGEIRVRLDGALFTSLRFGKVQKPYLYPVLGPGGEHVTRGYPMDPRPGEARDHAHHTSLWFAHGDVDGHDFWHGGHGERIVHVQTQLPLEAEAKAGELVSTFEWRSAADEVVCTERRIMRFAGTSTSRTIDFDITLTTTREAVTFGDTKEGTFAMRLAPTLRLSGDVAQGSARNSEGVEGADVWGKRARWMEYAGPIDGTHISVAIFDHPNNPRHPTWWHARAYGLLAANPFGRRAFEGRAATGGDLVLDPKQAHRFRYRVVIHAGARDAAQIDAEFAAWATPDPE